MVYINIVLLEVFLMGRTYRILEEQLVSSRILVSLAHIQQKS